MQLPPQIRPEELSAEDTAASNIISEPSGSQQMLDEEQALDDEFQADTTQLLSRQQVLDKRGQRTLTLSGRHSSHSMSLLPQRPWTQSVIT